MKIVALGHRKKVGKDTFARFIVRHIRMQHPSIKVKLEGFADALKDVAYRLYAWTGLQPGSYYELHPEDKDKLLISIGKTPRALWIVLAKALRDFDPKIFADALLKTRDCDVLIIKDLRYYVEINELPPGTLIARIERETDEPLDAPDGELSNYNWPMTIYNNGSVQELYKKAIDFTEDYLI
jgi:hypothetical protein